MAIEFSHLPPETRQVVISVNPKAGATSAHDRVGRLGECLRREGFEATVLTNLDEVAAEANRLFTAGHLRGLVAVGGDGTAAELVNRTLPGVPLAILPAGNENLLARHFHLGPSPEECCRTLAGGRLMRLDAARAGDRVFLLMIGCGFDAQVVHALHNERTGHVNRASYLAPILRAMRDYDYPEIRIYWNEDGTAGGGEAETVSADVRWLFAFNLPCYGAGLRIAPDADGGDGLLDVCTFRQGGLLRGIWYTAAVFAGLHRKLPDFAQRRAGRIRVTSEGNVPYQLDGDPGGFLPVEIEVLPRRLTLAVPEDV